MTTATRVENPFGVWGWQSRMVPLTSTRLMAMHGHACMDEHVQLTSTRLMDMP